jgi:hypothetical protein
MRLLTLLAVLALALPVSAQFVEPPITPDRVAMPSNVVVPDLSGYTRCLVTPDGAVTVERPDGTSVVTTLALATRDAKTLNKKAVAWLFAPGQYGGAGSTITEDHIKRLWSSRTGESEERPFYIGPLDRTDMPRIQSYAFFALSYWVHVQGIVFQGRVKFTGNSAEVRQGLVEGCYLENSIYAQSGLNTDGSRKRCLGLTVRDCWIMAGEGQGIYMEDAEDFAVQRCVLDYHGGSSTRDHALYFKRGINTLVEDCVISRPSSSGAKLEAVGPMTIRNCFFIKCHNALSPNANPAAGNLDKACEDLTIEGNIITRAGRKMDGPSLPPIGRIYLGWASTRMTIRGNLWWDMHGTGLLFQPPIFGAEFAATGSEYLVEDNMTFGLVGRAETAKQEGQGQFIYFTGSPDTLLLDGLVIRNNIIAEHPAWEGTKYHTDPIRAGEWFRPEDYGVTGSGNIWPHWLPSDPRHMATVSSAFGAPKRVLVRHPDRTIDTFASEVLGVEGGEAGFYRALPVTEPKVMIEALQAYFREAAEIVSVEDVAAPAPPLPWVDPDFVPPVEEPPDEEPPVEDPPVEDPPVEDPPVEDPPVEDPPDGDGEVVAVIRIPVGAEWVEITIRRGR